MKGYAWDGPSGPIIDAKSTMRGSLVHDALYQLMREGHLGVEHRVMADKTLILLCQEDGMSAFRRWYIYLGVRRLASFAVDPKNDHKAIYAPEEPERHLI